ncbi:MAG: large-conductance mechanosensitive channel [Bacteroidota bacterium]
MSEFRQFALKRNALDLAIGVVLGAAFQRVVDALVNEVLMPPLTWLSGNVDTGSWTIKLGPIPIGIGSLINAVLQFGLISFSVFILVQALNRIHRRNAEHPSSEPSADSAVEVLREIRDLLKKEPKS